MNWYEIKNKTESDSVDVMVYGPIYGGSDKWEESDVVAQDFIKAVADLGDKKIINLYINSPGGSVFTTSGIIAILQRAKDKGVTINAYIDGLAASAASFLAMAADNIFVYDTSILMIHRAMSSAYGNADDMQATIDILVKLEDSIIIPMYESKAKGETDWLDLMKAETWMDSKTVSELFNVTVIENTKKIAACLDPEVMANYKHIPERLKVAMEIQEPAEEPAAEEPKADTSEARKELHRTLLKLEL